MLLANVQKNMIHMQHVPSLLLIHNEKRYNLKVSTII
jgi:hypothetical protein